MAMCMYLKRALSSSSAYAGGGDCKLISGITARSFHKNHFEVKVGISEFCKGVGRGVEGHVAKLEAEIGSIQKLLETRTLKLKKLGIPCQHRKLILSYAQKYRLGLWRPRAEPRKA